jgi:enamine deaminase RidA (YjgF/YER057c/UK114 family)
MVSQTVVVQSATYKTIYISGQILGTTLEAQTTAAFKNMKRNCLIAMQHLRM